MYVGVSYVLVGVWGEGGTAVCVCMGVEARGQS